MKHIFRIFFAIFIFLNVAWASENVPEVSEIEILKSQIPNVIGIEYLLSTTNDGPIFRRWGHAQFLLRNPKLPLEKNIVVEFVADIGHENLNYAKGLVGSYDLKISIMTLRSKLLISSYFTGQEVERSIIPLKTDDLNKILNELLVLAENQIQLGKYTFLSNNCSGGLSKLFDFAQLGEIGSRIPNKLDKNLFYSGLAPFPKINFLSLKNIRKKIVKILGKSIFNGDEDSDTFQNLTEEQIKILFSSMKKVEFAYLIYHDYFLNDESKNRIRNSLKPYYNEISFNEVSKFESVNSKLYQVSESDIDNNKVNTLRFEEFSFAGLKRDLDFLYAQQNYKVNRNPTEFPYINLQIKRILQDPRMLKIKISDRLNVDLKRFKVSLLVNNNEIRYQFIEKEMAKNGKSSGFTTQSRLVLNGIQINEKIKFENLLCKPQINEMDSKSNCILYVDNDQLFIVGFNDNK